MKILGIDPGDQWIGLAISDSLCMFARPLHTVTMKNLTTELTKIFKEEETIEEVVVGYPITMSDTESEQTKKVVILKEFLEKRFSDVRWTLWDERYSSQQADELKRAKNKEDKIKSHSVAAAFILKSYLDYKYVQQ